MGDYSQFLLSSPDLIRQVRDKMNQTEPDKKVGPAPRQGWEPTQLSPFEEAQFQRDMREGDGYKQWRDGWIKQYNEEPNYDDAEGDYDYRGAWKHNVRPALYQYDGTYHWGSSTEDGAMLQAPDHPTAWMEYFMRATGKDPNEVGVKNEEEGQRWIEQQKAQRK